MTNEEILEKLREIYPDYEYDEHRLFFYRKGKMFAEVYCLPDVNVFRAKFHLPVYPQLNAPSICYSSFEEMLENIRKYKEEIEPDWETIREINDRLEKALVENGMDGEDFSGTMTCARRFIDSHVIIWPDKIRWRPASDSLEGLDFTGTIDEMVEKFVRLWKLCNEIAEKSENSNATT